MCLMMVKGKEKPIVTGLVAVHCWVIWLARNKRIFNRKWVEAPSNGLVQANPRPDTILKPRRWTDEESEC